MMPSFSVQRCCIRHRSLLALDLRCLELSFFRKKFEDYSRAFIGRM
jgi:hypothetical protein